MPRSLAPSAGHGRPCADQAHQHHGHISKLRNGEPRSHGFGLEADGPESSAYSSDVKQRCRSSLSPIVSTKVRSSVS